jgi:hypothetical protein
MFESADRWTTFGPRTLRRHHRACPGDDVGSKRCAFPHRDGRDRPGQDVVGVRSGAGMMCVTEPAPVGPGLGSPEPEIDRGWRDRQPGSMGMMEWKSRSASSRTAFLGGQERQAQSTAAGVVRLLDGGLRPIPTTRPHPGPPVDRGANPATGPCLLPHCDASRARPSQKQICAMI